MRFGAKPPIGASRGTGENVDMDMEQEAMLEYEQQQLESENLGVRLPPAESHVGGIEVDEFGIPKLKPEGGEDITPMSNKHAQQFINNVVQEDYDPTPTEMQPVKMLLKSSKKQPITITVEVEVGVIFSSLYDTILQNFEVEDLETKLCELLVANVKQESIRASLVEALKKHYKS